MNPQTGGAGRLHGRSTWTSDPVSGVRLIRTPAPDMELRRLSALESAARPADLRRFEGLAVGGLGEVPVRW
ncbi:hypothetical protein [Streptomyces sviceus]|uniref:hypothetical protein n=1 Tax=Streptomyces sviceus TaxID=285530 RepID=UPI0036A41679